MTTPARILLLGGIGTGKSAAAAVFGELGAVVVNADRLGHEVLGAEAREAVAERWPAAHDAATGTIDRRTLAAHVFGHPDELAELEAITHPAISNRIEGLVASHPDDVVVVEMPLLKDLVGPGWIRVAVTAPLGVRIARLAERGMDQADVAARMAAQPSPDEFAAAADHEISNAGSLDELRAGVVAFWEEHVTPRLYPGAS